MVAVSVSAAQVYPSGDLGFTVIYAYNSNGSSSTVSSTISCDGSLLMTVSDTITVNKAYSMALQSFEIPSSLFDDGVYGTLSLGLSLYYSTTSTKNSVSCSASESAQEQLYIIVNSASGSTQYSASSCSVGSSGDYIDIFFCVELPEDWTSIVFNNGWGDDVYSPRVGGGTGYGNTLSLNVQFYIAIDTPSSPGGDDDSPYSANWDYYYFYDELGVENPAVYHVSGDSLPAEVDPEEFDNAYRYWTDGIFLYGLEAGYYYTLTIDTVSGGAIGEVIAYQNGTMYDNVTLRKESMSSKYEITFECLNGGTAENRIGFTLMDYWYVESGYEYLVGTEHLHFTISLTQGEYTGNTASSSSAGSGAVVVKPSGSTGGGSEKSDSSSSTGSNANNNNAAVTWQEWHYTYDDEGNIVGAELVWKINLGDYQNYTQSTLNTLFMSAMCYYSWAWSVDDDGNITYYSGGETDSWLDQMWRLSVRTTLAVEGIYEYIDGLEGSLDGLSSTLSELKERVTKTLDREDEYLDAASDYTDAYETARDNASSSASSVNDISSSFSEITDTGVDASALFDAFADDEPWLWFSDEVLEDLSPGSSGSISTFSSSDAPDVVDYYTQKMDELEALISKSGE